MVVQAQELLEKCASQCPHKLLVQQL